MAAVPIEVWGGLECSVTRLQDSFRDQIRETGHHERPQDLAAVRALGIETVRYPITWETVAPDLPGHYDWTWADDRMGSLLALGIRPIVGLLHHGSGPRYTSLLDPNLPDLFADYAEAVARRYPWVERYTPVNEPLTTARFSALYGHWYPHARDIGSFLRALVIQCKATVLAMGAIRRIAPTAQLIQTEDVGKTFSTTALRGQAEYENERRWLSLDLLCGKVDRHHPWHEVFVDHGVSVSDLDLFLQGDVVPDVIGVNHYLTSERFLDENRGFYPIHLHAHNGRQAFADVEAVRTALPEGDLGPLPRLMEVWARYGRPMAVTEVHHGCTRDEQLRWLIEVWEAAKQLRQQGAEIKAVTIWSLFGAFDWNSLLTARYGAYEPGAFDIRAPQPRLTGLGKAVERLARTGAFNHPVLDTKGWWRRAGRFYGDPESSFDRFHHRKARPLLITGGAGPLARAVARLCRFRGIEHRLLSEREFDMRNRGAIDALMRTQDPWALVHAAQLAPAGIEADNLVRPSLMDADVLARTCASAGIPLVAFSSDSVFDGHLGRSYVETDEPCPMGETGRRAAMIEKHLTSVHPDTLIIRSGPLFSVWDQDNFAMRLLDSESRTRPPALPATAISPAYVPDLVQAVLDLLIDAEHGVWHLSNPGQIDAREFARRLGAETALAVPVRAANREPPPLDLSLSSLRGWPMPSLDDAIARFLRDAERESRLIPAEAAE